MEISKEILSDGFELIRSVYKGYKVTTVMPNRVSRVVIIKRLSAILKAQPSVQPEIIVEEQPSSASCTPCKVNKMQLLKLRKPICRRT